MTTLSPVATQPTVVAVAPTTTTIAQWNVRFDEVLTVQLENLDLSQTLNAYVQRRLADGNDWAQAPLDYFEGMAPDSSVVADLDVRGTRELRIVGTMSGAGGDVRVTAVRRAAR